MTCVGKVGVAVHHAIALALGSSRVVLSQWRLSATVSCTGMAARLEQDLKHLGDHDGSGSCLNHASCQLSVVTSRVGRDWLSIKHDSILPPAAVERSAMSPEGILRQF